MAPIKVFHFDIKTLGNYGDTILFEAVRQTFQGYGDRNVFRFLGTRNLRDPVDPKLVGAINDNYDAVVIGGGGLFLADTNPNERSGWQWNISIEQLKRIQKPLIVFAVGNNRFPGQADFSALFKEHLNIVVDKALFVGLRNNGSVNTIREYLAPELRHKVVYQPCPTTMLSCLCPDLFVNDIGNHRRAGFQALVGKRQLAAGFNLNSIYDQIRIAIFNLQRKGVAVEVFANARGDKAFHSHLRDRGLRLKRHDLFQIRDVFAPLNYIARLPISVGMRGHAQMVPFGLGNPIVSLFVHDKLRYFLEDIGHLELLVDVTSDRLANEITEKVIYLAEEFENVRSDFLKKQLGMWSLTIKNLSDIEHGLTGNRSAPTFVPYSRFERHLSNQAYLASLDKEELAREYQTA